MLAEKKIPNITDVQLIFKGRGLRIQFGNNTHFVDKRDLFNIRSWNDRDDNRKQTLKRIVQKKKGGK